MSSTTRVELILHCKKLQTHAPLFEECKIKYKFKKKIEVVHQFFLLGNKCFVKLLILVLFQSMLHGNVLSLSLLLIR